MIDFWSVSVKFAMAYFHFLAALVDLHFTPQHGPNKAAIPKRSQQHPHFRIIKVFPRTSFFEMSGEATLRIAFQMIFKFVQGQSLVS